MILESKELSAYEIKFVKTLSSDMAKPITQFVKDNLVTKAVVLSLHEKETPLAPGVVAKHWSAF